MHRSKSWFEDANQCHITQGHVKQLKVEFKFDLSVMVLDRYMLSWIKRIANMKRIIAKWNEMRMNSHTQKNEIVKWGLTYKNAKSNSIEPRRSKPHNRPLERAKRKEMHAKPKLMCSKTVCEYQQQMKRRMQRS